MMTSLMRLRRTLIATLLAGLIGLPAVSVSALGQDSGRHVVKAGDTLFGIARTYGIPLDTLRAANRISGDDIRVGQVLVIPVVQSRVEEAAEAPPASPTRDLPPRDSVIVPVVPENADLAPEAGSDDTPEAVSGATPEPVSKPFSLIDVRPGQSLYDLAFSLGIAVDSVLALNPDLPTFLQDIQVRVPSEYATGGQTTYRVRSGDTLYKIARDHGTSVEAIRQANRLSTDVISVGQELVVAASARPEGPRDYGPTLIASGKVRPYPSRFEGRLMAGGEAYDPDRFVVSHADLPFGSILLLTNRENATVGNRLSRRPRR